MGFLASLGRRRDRQPTRQDIATVTEETRLERAKLGAAVADLSVKRQYLEELMTRMLEERRGGA
jgi:hypothetical protein